MNELQTWLLPQAPGVPDAWRLAQTNECEVAVHLAYASYFKRLAELFDLTQSGDQIFLVGWEFGLDEELRPGDKTSAVLEQAIRQRGVRVRLLATGGGGTVRLLTDGHEIYARTATGDVFNLLKAPTQALLVIGDEGLLKELAGKVKRKRRKKRISGSERPSPDRRPVSR